MKKIILSLSLLLSAITISAQPDTRKEQPPFNPEEFQQMVEESLTKAANLTPAEAKAFFLLYNEMRKKQRQIGKQIHDLKKNIPDNNKACIERIQQIKKKQVEQVQMEQQYYNRFVKAIPAEKVLKLMKAEDEFHRRMVQRQQPRRDNHRHPEGKPDGDHGKQRPTKSSL